MVSFYLSLAECIGCKSYRTRELTLFLQVGCSIGDCIYGETDYSGTYE